MRNIYLSGFMGCGKSHIGKRLARTLDMPFIDLDEYIVGLEKMPIPKIFEKKGEQYFRDAETRYIRELDGCVIATGGGAMLRDETSDFAASRGVRVFINTSFMLCYKRISGDGNRPIVVNNTREQLKELYQTRKPIYQKNCDISVGGNRSAGEIVRIMTDKIAAFEQTEEFKARIAESTAE